MKRHLISLLNTLHARRYRKHCVVDKTSSVDYRRLVVRGNSKLYVADHSVLLCTIVFEGNSGELRVGSRTYIGASVLICTNEIVIGNDVLIAWGCTIIDHNSHSIYWDERRDDVARYLSKSKQDWSTIGSAKIAINDKAWVGFNSTIMKGVTIGEGAVVAAGSVVVKDVPPYCVVGGNPARVVKEIARTSG
jgi:galactoside O-acetyltransferase